MMIKDENDVDKNNKAKVSEASNENLKKKEKEKINFIKRFECAKRMIIMIFGKITMWTTTTKQ